MKKYQSFFLVSILINVSISSYATDGVIGMTASLTNSYVVVSNYGAATVSVCPITDASSGALGTCTSESYAGPDGSALLENPAQSVFNPNNNTLYITNQGNNSITVCTYGSTSETVACSNYYDTGFSAPSGVALNSDGTALAVTNGLTGNISLCSVDSETGQINNDPNQGDPCALGPTLPHGTNNLSGIAFNSTNDALYISADFYTGNIAQCSISGSSSYVNYTCSEPSDGDYYFDTANYQYMLTYAAGPAGLALSADGTTLFAANHFTNSNGVYTLTTCSLTEDNISSCSFSAADATYNAPEDIALYTASSTTTFAYVANYSGTGSGLGSYSGLDSASGTGSVSICPVTDNVVGTCTASFTDPSFYTPNGITVMTPA